MSLRFELDPRMSALAGAIGLVDGDGHVDSSWFEDPVAHLGRILTDPRQREALFRLLDEALPPEDGDGAPPGARWHPIVRSERATLFLTVQGETIGVAGSVRTPEDVAPSAQLAIRLPLVDAASGVLEVVAGTSRGPLEVALDVELPPREHPSAIGATVRIAAESGASVRIVLEGLDLGDGGAARVVLDPAHLDAQATRAVQGLLRRLLAELGDSAVLRTVVNHLPGVLGLDGAHPLPFADLLDDPGALRRWLAALAGDTSALGTWFQHLAGLVGAPSEPSVRDAPTPDAPWRATLLPVGDGSALELTLARRPAAAGGEELLFGLQLGLAAGPAHVEARAWLAAVPLSGSAPATPLPEAFVGVRAPGTDGLVDTGALRVGALVAGARWNGSSLVPVLALHDVRLDDGVRHPSLDLTSVNAIVNAAADGLADALEQALGVDGVGHALLALVGLRPPASDPAWPHCAALSDLVSAPTRTIAGVHRAALSDPNHGWSHLFGELARLCGLGAPGPAAGTEQAPWHVTLSTSGPAELQLAAWNARADGTPAGTERLRLGLRLVVARPAWTGTWLCELLAFELHPDGTDARFGGGQRLSVSVVPPAAPVAAGLRVAASRAGLGVGWEPARGVSWGLTVEGLEIGADGEQVGPFDVRFPSPSDLDPRRPDLGLGIPIADVDRLLKLLLAHGAAAWGGAPGLTLTGLLGLHARLPGLPADWPTVALVSAPGSAGLLNDPVEALRDWVSRIATGAAGDGTPHIVAAIPFLAGLLSGALGERELLAPVGAAPTGAGTPDVPWTISLGKGEGAGVQVLLWLEPEGPPASWIEPIAARVNTAVDASTLVAALESLREWADLPAALASQEDLAGSLAALDAWLALGDGMVPTASQWVEGSSWRMGTPLATAHHDELGDPSAVGQIRDQLAAWGHGAERPVALLLAPAFAGPRAYEPLLRAIDPTRPPDAHFDLRSGVGAGEVTAVAATYTACLPEDGEVDHASRLGGLDEVVARVRALARVEQVVLVGHSTAGVLARSYAAAHPTFVRGVVTIGAPHGGSPLTPLTDPRLAEAVRFCAGWLEDAGDAPLPRAVRALAAALDGCSLGADGPFRAAGAEASAFAAGSAPPVDSVPGLALASALPGRLLSTLARAAVGRAQAKLRDRLPPTHLALGARVRLPTPVSVPGEVRVEAALRANAVRMPLRADVPEPTRPTGQLTLLLEADRPGGWLVGGPRADDHGDGIRIRSAAVGARLELDAAGGARATPIVRLHDAAAEGVPASLADLATSPRLAGARPIPLSSAPPAPGSAAALALDVLTALGLVTVDAGGRRAFAPAALAELAERPTSFLGARVAPLLGALAAPLGLASDGPDRWTLALPGVPFDVALETKPWALLLRTRAGGLPLGGALALATDARLTLPQLELSADVGVAAGPVQLAWRGGTGQLTLAAPPWFDSLALHPAPPAGAVRDVLGRALPRIAGSALVSALAEALGAGETRLPPVELLFTDPGAWLTRPELLGRAGGGLDAAKVNALLAALAEPLGLDLGTATGLSLPGGFSLEASGTDVLALTFRGEHPIGANGDEVALALSLYVDAAMAVTVGGSASVDVALPGSWGRVGIAFGGDGRALSLVVTPGTAGPITLLPTFGGFGALAGAAVALLPHALQELVAALRPPAGPPTGVLGAALAVAQALGVYADDAQGFEAPDRVARLQAMLEPEWFAAQASSSSTLVAALAALFGPGKIQPPTGAIAASGDVLRYTARLPAGVTIAAGVGWREAHPVLEVEAKGIAVGPLVVNCVRLAYAGALDVELVLGLDLPGALSFLSPALEAVLSGERFAIAVLPLGAGTEADLAVALAPEPAFTATTNGALLLAERWGVPLLAHLLVPAFESTLRVPLWSGGTVTAQGVLESAGLVVPGSVPARIANSIPPIAEVALRALAALAAEVSFHPADGLTLSLASQGGRSGIRLHGSHVFETSAVDVSLRFGEADWLEAADAGITLWLLETVTGATPPFRIAPRLSAVGLGAVFSGPGDALLLDGSVKLEGVGGFVFLDAAFRAPDGSPTLSVDGFGAGVELDGVQVSLASEDGDSFISKILPKELAAPFDLAVAYRPETGIELHGGTSTGGLIEFTFPLDLDFTVIKIEELWTALSAGGGKARVEAGLTGRADIGPIHGVVERIGLKATFGQGGTGLSFRAPNGIGLSIDVGPVKGGGFLFIDEEKGQYAGVLQLNLQSIAITAIGLLNTKMPDGSRIEPGGFSLLVIIAVELPSIQLGFGFTLDGIGGLLGLNRTTDCDALRAGVRNRALDAMLFPPDPIGNAPTLIRTLNTVFPIAPNRFLIAPMVRLGWGSSILRLDLAILLDLPDPVRIAILGRLRVALPPTDGDSLVVINLDSVGIVDFGKGEVSLDAVIYDSKIVCFSLSGEMALRARWKGKPDFTLAVGGFHPAFKAPPGFPELQRIALSLAQGDNPRLLLETYFAVTTNTVQLGARVALHAEVAGFEADGQLAFDALVQFDPFGLMADFLAQVAIRYHGSNICSAELEAHLTGPAPWHVWGRAKVSVLFLSAEVDFDAQIGDAPPPPLPQAVEVAAKLLEALRKPENWTALPPSGETVVTLRAAGAREGIFVHPLGGLAVRQRIVPLGVTLEVFGPAPISGPDRFSIASVTVGTLAPDGTDELTDSFAPAQFFRLSDAEKLSRPAFETLPSGLELRFDAVDFDEESSGVAADMGYEDVFVDDHAAASTGRLPGGWRPDEFVHTGAAAHARVRGTGPARFAARAGSAAVVPRRYRLASAVDAREDEVIEAGSFTEAADVLRRTGQPRGGRLAVFVGGKR